MWQSGAGRRSRLVALFVVAVLLAIAGLSCRGAPTAREFDAREVVAAGNFAIQYGQKMQALGARMVEHGQTKSDQSWISDGQHWVIDGKRMVEIGEGALKLGQSMRGNPVRADEVDIAKVRVQGQGLINEGKAFIEHGQVMAELSDMLKRRATSEGDDRLAQDIADSIDAAKRMSQTGDQLRRSGEALVSFADSMEKSIGR